MKLIALLVLSGLITGCDDSIRSRSTITQSSSNSALKTSMAPKVGNVANIYKTSDLETFNFIGEEIDVVKSSVSTFIKSTILKVEGNLVYKLIETKTGANPTERKVQLEYIDLNTELNDLLKKNKAEVSGESIRIDMKLTPESMSEPQVFNNQMLSFDTDSEYEAIFSINKPFCEFRSVLTITKNLYLDGMVRDSSISEIWERASCGRELNLEELRNLDLKSISFCNETAQIKKCELKNLENLKP